MRPRPFAPTSEQARIIGHDGSAFVSACPGAGKTRVLVERAGVILNRGNSGKAVAFLSFTNAAISELELRLHKGGLLPSPTFPHFVGTFDSFLWRFLVAPFGTPGCDRPLRLIPDKGQRVVRPFERARGFPLECFDRTNGEFISAVAKRLNLGTENRGLTKAHATSATTLRSRFLQRGELDFSDARVLAAERIADGASSTRLARALAARFCEIVVDEAQDCNPSDLEIIQWLRDAGITTKVICDPHQSIYAFRGGVTEELDAFGQTFDEDDRLSMSGNFRSSDPICRAIVALRPANIGIAPDRALGEYSSVTTPVHILAYSGNGVPALVGAKFRELLEADGMDVAMCPVLAATRHSAARAIGQPSGKTPKHLTLRLARAVTDFYYSFETGTQRVALDEIHHVVLKIEDRIGSKTYHQFLAAEGIEPGVWRPRMLKLVRELRYDPAKYPDSKAWHAQAKALLAAHLPAGGRSIAQRLQSHRDLAEALSAAPTTGPMAKTIHAVKGMEFPAVCVVMTVRTTRGILDYLETGAPAGYAEDSRKIYVAASRAQRFLAIATHKTQAGRLASRLAAGSAPVTVVNL